MAKRRGGIQLKIIAAMLGVGLLPGLVGIYFAYLSGAEALKDSIGSNFQAIARKTAGKIDIIISREIEGAQALAISPLIESATRESLNDKSLNKPLIREVNKYIDRYKRQRKEKVISIAVVNRNGDVIASTGNNHPFMHNSWKTWGEDISKDNGKRVFVSDVGFDQSAQVYSILIAVPISPENNPPNSPFKKGGLSFPPLENGEAKASPTLGRGDFSRPFSDGIIGSVEVVYDIKDIFGSIINVEIGKTGHANLVDSTGTILICPLFAPHSHTINDTLLKQISTAKPGWGVTIDDGHGGKDSIIGFSPVKTTFEIGKENFGEKKWYIFIRQSPEETYAPLYTLLWKVSLLGSTLVIFLSFLGYYLARRIVKPIKILSRNASLIGKGQPHHDVDMATGDEIEDLAHIFNQMARDLEKRFQEIKLERDKLTTIMDSIGDGMAILDQDLKIQYMNAKFLEIYGMESIGSACYNVFGTKDSPCEECPLIKEGKDLKTHTAEIVTPSGRTYLVTHSPLKNIDGTVSIVDIYKDITERKRLEQQLLYSERLTALSQFSSTFAHDLRNPIIAVKKTLEMMRDNYGSFTREETEDIYYDLTTTCGLLLGLVNDMLDIHQVSYRELPLLFSCFSIRQTIEEAIKLLKYEADEKRVHVGIEDHGGDVWIEGDRRRLQRVFINLLSNALKYSPHQGNIIISFERHKPSEGSDRDDMLFKIEDEGPGIAPDELPKIFDLFYRADKGGIKSGTGIGLYFCKVVVEAHGGTIWAENREKGGAIFYIQMPLVRRGANAYQDSHSR